MQKADIDPTRFVAAEGVFGTLVLTLFLFITANIPCYSEKICEKDVALDSPAAAIIQLINDPRLLIYTLISIISIMVLNITGLSLTKYVSSLFKVIIGSMGTIVIWVISVILGFEKVEAGSVIMQLTGFTLLILCNLIYNEVIVLNIVSEDIDKLPDDINDEIHKPCVI